MSGEEHPSDSGTPAVVYRRKRLGKPRNPVSRGARRIRLDASEIPGDTTDEWLDATTDNPATARRGPRAWLHDTYAAPAARMRRAWSFVATTPGKMVALVVILAAAIFAAGYSMSVSSADRQDNLTTLLRTAEPTSSAAHNLYASLSLADTIATTNTVQHGLHNDTANTAAYWRALDRASAAASQISAGLPPEDRTSAELIAAIQRQLPVYSGLVEAARANNRQSNPVNVSYTAQASELMRGEILTAAAALFDRTTGEVSRQQHQLTRPQWVPLSGLVAAVIFLALAQWWLWKITRRRLNRGFLAATALMLVAIVWVSASNFVTWQAGTQGFEQASTPWQALTASRITAQQARTSETLATVRRQTIENTNSNFDQTTLALAGALDAYESADDAAAQAGRPRNEHSRAAVAQARTALEDWRDAHDALVDALGTGNFTVALALTTEDSYGSPARPTTVAAFDSLDDALSTLIADSRQTMRTFVAQGLAATALVSWAVLVASVLAVASVILGIRRRLQEYL
ncbi:hypothetical protein ACUY3K_03135 [Corynebacterium uberis]|uniref:hypothetical protein n=1 Tax=Corynebacterium TaxID=1716 RepID=UPI001D0BB785|nr:MULTISPECIES: hypothetical protein [Corynebacterium]MCZ9309709.1 hypothetical protein [Corynebacterium sp. c6VSa_13]UDL73513.1 hypothetical protein LH391_10610 [Corynebacterium uberis]UDL75607.1 hypothetical protein LH393_10315 [Corynebacterium uberis]UDL77820.1 hypothetical protein LH394_10300 [Corynebacterium uberis]UDL80103.1 hypothetical protein LH392_10720 [Corynebacterium uberis]